MARISNSDEEDDHEIYIAMLLYIQTMRAMEAAGSLLPGSEISLLLKDFCNVFPLQSLWIPGPLVYAFKSIACFKPTPSGKFGNVTSALPTRPGCSRSRRYRIANVASSHLPNISLFLSRLTSTCAAATRSGVTTNDFLNDVDGPRFMATLFGQACDHSLNEQANLTSPGAGLCYSGNLRLWQEASNNLAFLGLPDPLDVEVDEVTDNWTSFLRLSHDSNWFGSIAAMMTTYCQFWKGSVPLSECSASCSGAGVVRCTATSTDVFTPPAWTEQAGHYSLRPNLDLTFKSATSVENLQLDHVLAALTYNIYLSPNDDGHLSLRHGQFWNITPDAYCGTGIEIYPSIVSSIVRDYHSDSRIDSDRQGS